MFNIQEVSWNDISKEVHLVNPELATICDQIEPNSKLSLFKIRYPYGSIIVDEGIFSVPFSNNEVISLKDNRVPINIKNALNYCHIPLSLVLHNHNEVFVETSNRIIPLNYFQEGELFGIFESSASLAGTELYPTWSVTAGARSVFMLPKISDKIGHGKLKKSLGIKNEVPTSLLSQWYIFKEIIKKNNTNLWYNEILVFSKDWLDIKNINLLKFHQYLFKINWKQSKLLMDSVKFGLLWASFSEVLNRKRLKPSPYIVDTIKYLVSIANGSGVAFKPATDESALPLSLIQDVYINVYNLKSYIPTIMQPCTILSSNQGAYYSLAFPTILENTPVDTPSIINDEREIKLLINILLKTVKKTNLNNMFNHNIKYEFFHVDLDKYGEIIESKNVIIDDERFNYCMTKDLLNRKFCANALFFRGCIRVSIA